MIKSSGFAARVGLILLHLMLSFILWRTLFNPWITGRRRFICRGLQLKSKMTWKIGKKNRRKFLTFCMKSTKCSKTIKQTPKREEFLKWIFSSSIPIVFSIITPSFDFPVEWALLLSIEKLIEITSLTWKNFLLCFPSCYFILFYFVTSYIYASTKFLIYG